MRRPRRGGGDGVRVMGASAWGDDGSDDEITIRVLQPTSASFNVAHSSTAPTLSLANEVCYPPPLQPRTASPLMRRTFPGGGGGRRARTPPLIGRKTAAAASAARLPSPMARHMSPQRLRRSAMARTPDGSSSLDIAASRRTHTVSPQLLASSSPPSNHRRHHHQQQQQQQQQQRYAEEGEMGDGLGDSVDAAVRESVRAASRISSMGGTRRPI